MCGQARLNFVGQEDGLAEWDYVQGHLAFTVLTSVDLDTGPQVLSCGTPTNGIDVERMVMAVRNEAKSGWGIAVTSVVCMPTMDARGPLDQLPIGESAIACAVRDDDGNTSTAFVSVTSKDPHFRIYLGE